MHTLILPIKNRYHITIILLLYFLLCTTNLCAHPHLFITSKLEFVWNKKDLQGVYQTWTFDRFFSADIIQGYDLDHNGIFNKNETNDVYTDAFINTKNYSYFTFVRQKGERLSPQMVSKFSVWQKDGIVSYRFYIDAASYRTGNFYFAVYDYTFFCDFRYAADNPVTFSYDSHFIQPRYAIIENKRYPVYYDPLDTEDVSSVYTEWRPGLQVYYPKEIYIQYD